MQRELFYKYRKWISEKEPKVLIGVLFICLLLWLFATLAREVTEGETKAFDVWVVKSLRRPNQPKMPIGPSWMNEVGRDITALGGAAVLSLFALIGFGFLWLRKKYRLLVFMIFSIAGGFLISFLLKFWFGRPRPHLVPHLSQVYTSSFPSGHSAMSAVVYITIAFLVSSTFEDFRIKRYFFLWAFLLTFLVGLSRIYMGVHYPTDVFAGWIFGVLWTILCWTSRPFFERLFQ